MTWAFLFETDQYLSKLDNEETGNAFCFSEGWGPGRNEGHVMAEALNIHEQTGLTPAQLQARVAELEGAARKAYNRWAYAEDTFGEVSEAMNALAELVK